MDRTRPDQNHAPTGPKGIQMNDLDYAAADIAADRRDCMMARNPRFRNGEYEDFRTDAEIVEELRRAESASAYRRQQLAAQDALYRQDPEFAHHQIYRANLVIVRAVLSTGSGLNPRVYQWTLEEVEAEMARLDAAEKAS